MLEPGFADQSPARERLLTDKLAIHRLLCERLVLADYPCGWRITNRTAMGMRTGPLHCDSYEIVTEFCA